MIWGQISGCFEASGFGFAGIGVWSLGFRVKAVQVDNSAWYRDTFEVHG